LIVGGMAVLIYYMIFSVGWLVLSPWVPYLLMAVIANITTAVLTYPLYRSVVFRWTGAWLLGFLRFYVIWFWNLVFSMFGLPLLIELARVPVLVSQAIVLVVMPLINYQLIRHWAFRRR
jgi:putative flippase GtrA